MLDTRKPNVTLTMSSAVFPALLWGTTPAGAALAKPPPPTKASLSRRVASTTTIAPKNFMVLQVDRGRGRRGVVNQPRGKISVDEPLTYAKKGVPQFPRWLAPSFLFSRSAHTYTPTAPFQPWHALPSFSHCCLPRARDASRSPQCRPLPP